MAAVISIARIVISFTESYFFVFDKEAKFTETP